MAKPRKTPTAIGAKVVGRKIDVQKNHIKTVSPKERTTVHRWFIKK